MRLLVFTTQFPPDIGGVETMSWQLSKHLQAKGVDVTVLAPQIEGAAEFDALSGLKIQRFSLSDPKTAIAKWSQKSELSRILKRTARESNADCVLCTEWDPSGYVAASTRKSLGVPYFLIAHGMELMQLPRRFLTRRAKAVMRRRALGRAERVFAVSEFTRGRVISLGVPTERTAVIPNGVELQATSPNGRENGKAQILLTVSRLVARKGHDTVLRALPQIIERVPNVRYRIVGSGPELDRLQALTRDLRLDGHVEFLGQVSDSERERHLKECDLFILATRETPTDFEGFGIAVLEAMQNNKAVVVTRAGGVPEVVEHGRTGLVVEPENERALAGAVIRLFESRTMAVELGMNAAAVVREKYAWDKIAGRYATEIQSAISRSRRLRVAFLHPFLFRYARGIERYTFSLASRLASNGAEVSLVTWNWDTRLQINEIDSGVRIHRLPTSRYFAAKAIVPFYARHLRKQNYDFVWINFAGYGEADALRLVTRQRFGIVFHFPLEQVPHRYAEFKETGLIDRAEKIVSVSQHVAKGVREYFGRESTVVHHGVDAETFRPDRQAGRGKREELGLSRDAPVLLTAAALEERKGIQWVLRALPGIIKCHPEATYLVAGDGPYRSELEQLARQLGISDHVRFVGAQENIAPFYQTADLTLMLSRGEASSLSALESLACEAPVIAARRPPFDELIDGECGVMVDEEDAAAVAETVANLLADPARRQSMGRRGRARVSDVFTWERAAAAYDSIMQQSPAPTGAKQQAGAGEFACAKAASVDVVSSDRQATSGKHPTGRLARFVREPGYRAHLLEEGKLFARHPGAIGYKGGALVLNSVNHFAHRLNNRHKVKCCVCGWSGNTFDALATFGYMRRHARCPSCGALERHRAMIEFLEREGWISAGDRCLDVGGIPAFRNWFARHNVTYVSLSLGDPAMVCMNVQQLGFADDTFDLILDSHVLEYVSDYRQAVSELTRVLRPGGRMLMTEAYDLGTPGTHEFGGPNPAAAFMVRRFGDDLWTLLAESGFAVARWDYTGREDQSGDYFFLCQKETRELAQAQVA